MNKLEIVGKTVKVPAHERSAAEIEISHTFIDTGGGNYNFRESGAQAFTDNGDTITSESDSPAVADAMVRLANSKGAESFKHSGTKAFVENTEFAMERIQAEYDAVDTDTDADQRMEVAMAKAEHPPENTMSPEEASRYEQMAASVEPEDGYSDAMSMDDIRHMANLQMASSKDVQAAAYEAMGDTRSAADVRAEADALREKDNQDQLAKGAAITATAAKLNQGREKAAEVPQFTRIDDDDSVVVKHTAAEQANQQAQVAAQSAEDVGEVSAEPEDMIDAEDEAEVKRRTALAKKVALAYTVNGTHYMLKGDNPKEAFNDKGNKIIVKLEDERTVQDSVDLLASRGAKSMSISMSSTAVFKRLAWIAGQKHGMEVSGYKPTAQDIAAFQKQKAENVITDTTQQTKAAQQVAGQPAVNQAAAPTNQAAPAATPARQPVKGELSGELLEYGEDHYKHDPTEKKSYFVKVKQDDGSEREQWGVDLKSAVAISGVQEGDQVYLRKVETNDVTTKDKHGKDIIGHRASWVIEAPERAELNKADALRAAAQSVSTRFSRPEDRESMVNGMEDRIATRTASGVPLPEVMMRKQVHTATPVQREQEKQQQTQQAHS